MKSKFFLIFLFFIISSCSDKMAFLDNYPLVPEKNKEEKIDNIKVSYILPKNVLEQKGIDGLVFCPDTWGTDTKRERIFYDFNDRLIEIERRTDNGVAGSGLRYLVKIENTDKGNERLITFKPESVKTYQDGLVLPFPVPKFDLKSYLMSAKVIYKFDVTSNYPVDSIKANFNRMLKSNGSPYYLKLQEFSASLGVEIYPYRQGSKATILAQLYGMQASNDVINVSNNIKELEKYVKSIVND